MKSSTFEPVFNWLHVAIFLAMLLVFGQFAHAEGGVPTPKNFTYRNLGMQPIQSGGRIKPIDALARDVSLYITGSKKFQGWDPVELLLSWTIEPEKWADAQFVQITRSDVRKQLVLDPARKLFSPNELYQNPALAQYADRSAQPQLLAQTPVNPAPNKEDQRGQEFRKLIDRLDVLRALAQGEAWPLVPVSGQWEPVTSQRPEAKPVLDAFAGVLKAYHDGDSAQFDLRVKTLADVTQGMMSAETKARLPKLEAEVWYLRVHPYLWGAIFYLLAALFWSAAGSVPMLAYPGWTFTILGFVMVTGGLGVRSYIAGRPPVSNMYESVVWVSFGVILFTAILYFIQKQRHALLMAVGCFLSVFGLFAADSAPAMMDPSIHPLVPVLRDNFWLTTHVLTITLGYSAFALALGISNVTLWHYLRASATPSRVDLLNQLTYRAMQFGVVLLAAGTILGGVWADYSWGRFWGWDPKETWALIALLCYVAILHARFAGWVGSFGFAAWSVVSFLSVVMAWYGVNFVLGVGLHSYGFSAGGFSGVLLVVGAQMLYVIAAMVSHRSRKRAPHGTPAQTTG